MYHLKNRSANQEYEGELKQAQRISTNMDSFYPSKFHESTVKIHGLRDPVWPGSTPKENPVFSTTQKPTPVQTERLTPALTRCHWANAKPWLGSAEKKSHPSVDELPLMIMSEVP